jgi:hypothetical protein
MPFFNVRPALVGLALVSAALTGACRDTATSHEATVPAAAVGANSPQTEGFLGGVFGSDQPPPPVPGEIGVNTFLWRASLDTVSFMPVASADPFGGVIITDWYSPPETPTERFKVNIFILDRQLRSDGIKATVFRQAQTSDGRWIDSPVDQKTDQQFENSILTRARQLRIASITPQ